jgi:hypothetical protein
MVLPHTITGNISSTSAIIKMILIQTPHGTLVTSNGKGTCDGTGEAIKRPARKASLQNLHEHITITR